MCTWRSEHSLVKSFLNFYLFVDMNSGSLTPWASLRLTAEASEPTLALNSSQVFVKC